MQYHPLCLYLKFEGAEFEIKDLGRGVYPLMPTKRTWFVSEEQKVQARRVGFTLLPDLAGTSYMYQGTSLEDAIVDLLEVDHTSKAGDHMAAYVELSRVKKKEGLLITQPFSPGLFLRGPPVGPHVLMRLLRGEIGPNDVEDEFDRLEQAGKDANRETQLMKMKWTCRSCELQGEDSARPTTVSATSVRACAACSCA